MSNEIITPSATYAADPIEARPPKPYVVEVSVIAKRCMVVDAANGFASVNAADMSDASKLEAWAQLSGWQTETRKRCVGKALPGDADTFAAPEVPSPAPRAVRVVDPATGKSPDLPRIAREEDWARNLVYSDMDGFVLDEDGCLILLDECGHYAYVPKDRFAVLWED